MCNKILLLIAFTTTSIICFSQNQERSTPVLTADSLTTGNAKDVFNSFFQLAFDRFTGADKELRFTSTPFAVMAKMDTSLLIDSQYLKYKNLRKINFSISAKLDEKYKFNGFTFGIKYAIINKRDETISNTFRYLALQDSNGISFFALNRAIASLLSTSGNYINDYTAFRRGEKNFNQLDASFQKLIVKSLENVDSTKAIAKFLASTPGFNLAKNQAKIYDSLKQNYNNKLLWTVGVDDTTYNDQFMFSNVVLNTQILKGISNPKSKNLLEINIKGLMQFLNDSNKIKRNLNRSIITSEASVNWSLRTKETLKSYFEVQLGSSYNHILNGLYVNEVRDNFFLNTGFRVRIINDIWLPLKISYDPKHGKLLGFISVKVNFKGT